MPGDQSSNTSDGADSPNNLLPYMTKVAAMVKQLEALKLSLTTKQLDDYDAADLSVRLDFVEQVNATFEEAQSALEQKVTSELESCERMKFVSLYFDVKAKLTRQLNLTRKCDTMPRSSTMRQFSLDGAPFSDAPSSSYKPRLPEIQLPKFSGAYADWPNFYALFSTVIDDNTGLSDLEKFHHLRSNLTGTALDTISSLELNNTNYTEAVKLLKNRFDNKLLNFQTHVMELFSLKAVNGDSAVGLRHLSDKLNSHLRAMLTIAKKEQIADGLLIYLATTKMDKASQIKWEESQKMNELPTWESLSAFLERRCQMLENLENSVVGVSASQQIFKKANPKNRHVHVAASGSSAVCTFCDSAGHYITSCALFSNLAPFIRYKEAKRLMLCLNCLRKGHVLKKCTSGSCRKCSLKHHTMLHLEPSPSLQPSASPSDPTVPHTSQTVLVSSPSNTSETSTSNVSVLLATAVVLVKNKCGVFVPCRAILDSASQLNLMTSRFMNRLSLKCRRVCTTISGIGDGSVNVDKSVEFVVKSRCSDFLISLAAMVVPTITDYQPNVSISTSGWNIPKNIQLADPSFDKAERIDMLIGAEHFFELMSVGQIKLAENLPILQKTVFGWVVAGGGLRSPRSWSLAIACSEVKDEEEELSAIVKGFWEVENNFQSVAEIDDEAILCENHFVRNTVRLASGAYSVRLPLVEGKTTASLGGSYERALQRFLNLEKKFRRYPDIKAQYSNFVSEYAALNHMSLISTQVSASKYFLPHHCVHKLDSTSTKLRVVFDGSAKTTTGLSLNDILFAGPTIQPKLFNTLLRYRFFEVALSGDICKMYRCVRMSHPDDYLQCILWRENEEDEIQVYKLNTVTYGTKPAAFLAIRAMHQLAADEECNFPLGAKIVRGDFYVDDLISGGDSVQDVLAIRQQVSALLQKGEFSIRKWCSNVPAVLDGLPSDQCETMLKFHDGTDVTKTLGLVWDPKDDVFIFAIQPLSDWKVVTKRSILSSIARLYDPLGLVGPIITKAKIFMQHLWKINLDWDESLPQSLHSAWIDYVSKFDVIRRFTFPRYVSLPKSMIQLHAFCDASLAAYGACVYVRAELGDVIKTSLLCSKSRVSPLKTLTVPKLELLAASLMAELVDSVFKSLQNSCSVHCWSDSMVVLSWLREQPSKFNVFVANRVSSIQSYPIPMTWHYVPTNLNPADILSRGASPEELLCSKLWNSGPHFLLGDSSSWPDNVEFLTELPECRRNVLVMTSLTDLSMQCQSEVLTPGDIKNGTYLLIKNIHLLCKGDIYLNKCRLNVEPSPTWEQPFSTGRDNQLSKDGNIGITHLNDDCLLNIFKMLDTRDQIRLSQSHVRFEVVFLKLVCPYFSPSQLRFCELYSKLSDWELWYFLKNAGAYIRDLELHSRSCNSDFFYELMKFCTQVLRIQIAYVKLPMLLITSANNMLQEIELYKCDLCDGGVELLAQLENLRDLALVECPNITGKTLFKLKKIQRLSVYGCRLLIPRNLEAACIAMNLNYLDIRKAFCLHTIIILNHCSQLETLKLSADECTTFSSITKCDVLKSSLKSLEFYEIHDKFAKLQLALQDNGLHNLETLKLAGEIDFVCNINLKQCFPRLRTLWLCFHSTKQKLTEVPYIHKLEHLEELFICSALFVDEEFFVSIVNNCYMLRRLIIRNCPYLSDNFFMSCYDTMQNRANSSGEAFKHITIYLCKTYIRKAGMEPSFYNNNYMRVKKFKKLPAMGSFKEDNPFENISKDFCPCISDEDSDSDSDSDSE